MNKLLLLLVLVSATAVADEVRYTYGGVSAGESVFKKSNDVTSKLYLGHRVLPYVGFEAAVYNFGDVKHKNKTTNDKTVVSTAGANPQLAFYLPLDALQFFGKVGIVYWESKTKVNGNKISKDHGSGLSFGGGFQIFFGHQFFARGEIEELDLDGRTGTETLVTFGIGFAI